MSIGISFFSVQKQTDNETIQVENRTYNILTYSEEFQVEARSLKFLIDHGFDLNKLFLKGLKHYRGNDKLTKNDDFADDSNYTVRSLISELSKAKLPIVLHNGFIDLIFLYQNFYAQLPDTSIKFLADLEEIFSAGVYDTKYIAEFHLHLNTSFLEYLYKKALYENTQKKSFTRKTTYVEILFPLNEQTCLKLSEFNLDLKRDLLNEKKICSNYSMHGYCAKIETCNKSHDINLIIQAELLKKKPRKSYQIESESNESNPKETLVDEAKNEINKAHSAGLDSFMTGFILLNYINKTCKFETGLENFEPTLNLNSLNLESIKNKIYLTGKDYPLMVRKSNFATTSLNHKEKQKTKTEINSS